MARLALTPILAAAPTFASAFSDQDFCSAARQFAAAIERDVGIWVDRTTRNAGVGVFCERKSVEFWHFTYISSASMDEAWQRRKAGDWNSKQCASLKLPRFRGHPTFWVEGVHDVEAKSTLPT